jgi:hypothetical protein
MAFAVVMVPHPYNATPSPNRDSFNLFKPDLEIDPITLLLKERHPPTRGRYKILGVIRLQLVADFAQ